MYNVIKREIITILTLLIFACFVSIKMSHAAISMDLPLSTLEVVDTANTHFLQLINEAELGLFKMSSLLTQQSVEQCSEMLNQSLKVEV